MGNLAATRSGQPAAAALPLPSQPGIATALRRWAGHGVALALSAVFLWLAVRRADLAQAAEALLAASPALVALAALTVLATLVAKTLRWRVLYPAEHARPGFRPLFAALLLGQLVNNLLPARAGEVARALAAGHRAGGATLALATIVVEKAFDAAALVLLALILAGGAAGGAIALPGGTGVLHGPGAPVIGGAALLGLLFALGWQAEHVGGWLGAIAKRGPTWWRRLAAPVAARLRTMVAALVVLRRPAGLAALAWTAGIWLVMGLTNVATQAALGLPAAPAMAFTLLVVTHVGLSLPSAPGRLGVFHYLVVAVLTSFGVADTPALTYAVLLYLVAYLPPTALGLWALWEERTALAVAWRTRGKSQ